MFFKHIFFQGLHMLIATWLILSNIFIIKSNNSFVLIEMYHLINHHTRYHYPLLHDLHSFPAGLPLVILVILKEAIFLWNKMNVTV